MDDDYYYYFCDPMTSSNSSHARHDDHVHLRSSLPLHHYQPHNVTTATIVTADAKLDQRCRHPKTVREALCKMTIWASTCWARCRPTMCGNCATGLERKFVRASGAHGSTFNDVPRGRMQAGSDSGDGGATVSGSGVVGDDDRSVRAGRDGTVAHDGTSVLEMGWQSVMMVVMRVMIMRWSRLMMMMIIIVRRRR